ncbi:MAG: single-stranded-DNA-specific exonuclease RecJ [Solirubrobacterales bacterium]
MASTEIARAFTADPYDYGEARRIAAALELAEPIAVTLVRRGYRTVEAAREFLEAADRHDPLEFDGIGEVVELALSHARRGAHVTVHGDYDVDGVCSTSILVSTLRALGARCDWFIPDRLSDGYGLSMASVEELRRRGSELVITVDCGITAVDEVAAAREAGIEVVVSDHHEPPERLPDCPIVHPVVSGYPFSALCAAGVAHKLSVALRGAGGLDRSDRGELDLVALATVADMVPLIGENRRLVREGLAVLRRAPRPGLRALMAVSRVQPESVDEQALGFRLAPRINAAGRLYRADAGVELMLTDDPERAAAIAAELDRANAERRAVEREVSNAAESARAALPQEQAGAAALVLAGEGWHAGVVGIAASRLADEHWRPVVLLSLDGEVGRGSARSIPGFDLIAALDACSEHLVRHGGHRAAAGLELRRGDLDAFREAFVAYAAERIDPADLVQTETVDALVGVGREGIGMDLAEQLERLGPFGQGNPGPRLIVPSARLRTIRPLGEGGKHSRFDLESGAGRALGVAFGVNGGLEGHEDERLDLSVSLEVDRWNGAVQPRVVLRELYPLPAVAEDAEGGALGCTAGGCPSPDDEWWSRLQAELGRTEDSFPPALGQRPASGSRREVVERRGGAAVAALAELVSSGESVLALCADASRRRALAGSAADPRRFGAGAPLIACGRCGEEALDSALGVAGGEPDQAASATASAAAAAGLVLADWGALARRPGAPARFQHVVLVDPPPFEQLEQLAIAARPGAGAGFAHLAWGAAELELAERCLELEWEPRGAVEQTWRLLVKAGGGAGGEELRSLLAGAGHHPRTPELGARIVAILEELGLCEWCPDGAASTLRVVSSEPTELERSRAYGACVARHQEGKRFLRSRAQSS